MFDINAWEFVIILVVAFVVIGPERLPEYAARLARLVRRTKVLADDARRQLRDQMGPEFDDIDWRAYDPRQYDPRRIVRDALAEPASEADSPTAKTGGPASVGHEGADDHVRAAPVPRPYSYDAARATPFDEDAT